MYYVAASLHFIRLLKVMIIKAIRELFVIGIIFFLD